MKKGIYLLGLLSVVALASCDKEENLNQLGTISPADFPTATLTGVPASYTTIEGEDTIIITVTLDKPFIMDTEVFISQTAGDTDGDDIDARSVYIEAGATTAELVVYVHGDSEIEGTESGTLTITAGPNLKLTPAEFTITLENYVSPLLTVYTTWGPSFNGDTPQSLVDWDLYIFDSDDAIVARAETGAFETMNLSVNAGDGDYVVYAYLYDAASFGSYGPLETPLTVTFSRGGVFGGVSLPQNAEDVVTTDDIDALIPLAQININNGVFTVSNLDDVTIVSGRAEKLADVLAASSRK